jgi:hypothetical protein
MYRITPAGWGYTLYRQVGEDVDRARRWRGLGNSLDVNVAACYAWEKKKNDCVIVKADFLNKTLFQLRIDPEHSRHQDYHRNNQTSRW